MSHSVVLLVGVRVRDSRIYMKCRKRNPLVRLCLDTNFFPFCNKCANINTCFNSTDATQKKPGTYLVTKSTYSSLVMTSSSLFAIKRCHHCSSLGRQPSVSHGLERSDTRSEHKHSSTTSAMVATPRNWQHTLSRLQ